MTTPGSVVIPPAGQEPGRSWPATRRILHHCTTTLFFWSTKKQPFTPAPIEILPQPLRGPHFLPYSAERRPTTTFPRTINPYFRAITEAK